MKIEENAADAVEVLTEKEGRYAVTITGNEAKGDYDISWRVRE